MTTVLSLGMLGTWNLGNWQARVKSLGASGQPRLHGGNPVKERRDEGREIVLSKKDTGS